ncbi:MULTISPECIES: hypothetical protein [Paraburkholderia]|uniref:Uncharacterized protein n=1 Tax=Paraburkholderia podalyriae TaxID=1938811 RepID=A0ABR7Q0Z7_9BURK|nr:hypothetical protein [Paraburkholderia podalyriae]MBC8752207.1 hypothetical protein [Paraburkholderia podalyriae]
MEESNYANVRDIQNFPSFHDAELFRIEHRRDEREFELGFKRVNGEIEVLLFKQVISLRMLDFAEQNVVSRVLLSPKHSFSVSDVRTIIGWIRSWPTPNPRLYLTSRQKRSLRTYCRPRHIFSDYAQMDDGRFAGRL